MIYRSHYKLLITGILQFDSLLFVTFLWSLYLSKTNKLSYESQDKDIFTRSVTLALEKRSLDGGLSIMHWCPPVHQNVYLTKQGTKK